LLELPPPPPAPPELVSLRQVRVAYGESVILTDVTWTVRAGECWALQGPNGSGKTTLLSLLNGDNPQAYANDIRLFGRPRGSGESIWDLKRRIGWVAPEMQAHYAPATACREVVASGFFDSIGLYRDPTAEQQAEVARWLAGLGLAAHADQPFGALSAGEQRLVLFARALVKNPPLLVLDEPCVGLDPANRDRIVRLVDALGRQPGRALIYVTHHEEELPPAITHRLRLAQGRVVACGPR
jgi:molybdate transport system ATP-binding protein